MALFRVNLDEQLEEHLDNAAQYQRHDRSEIVRQALTEYFSSAQNHVHDDEAIWDETQCQEFVSICTAARYLQPIKF